MNNDDLLKILACPQCKGPLTSIESGNKSGFLCSTCELIYPVKDEIPIMLVEEAIPASEWRIKAEK